jgi:hypothetical protein
VSVTRTLFALAGAAFASLVTADALACGAPFGSGMSVDPKQDIIVVHKAGVETYVFQPTFCGDAKDFGLLLPVPSLLSKNPSLGKAGAFTQLDALSRPKDVYTTECAGRGGDGMDAGVGGYGDASNGTTIVASGRVGFLDWVQLQATDQASFTAWLDANHYPYDPSAKSAFDYYVGKHWYFLAFKVAQDAAHVPGGCTALGPIVLKFPTATPVVPSRMASAGATATGSGEQPPGMGYFAWRIFGITDGAKQIDFGGYPYVSYSGALGAGQLDSLDGLASAGDRLTKITMTFTGATSDDRPLVLSPPLDYRETVTHVTYVQCDDAGPGDDAGPVTHADGGGGGGGLGATPSVGGGACATTRESGRSGALFGACAAGVLALAAIARRARGARRRER